VCVHFTLKINGKPPRPRRDFLRNLDRFNP
jgi:hypothetical protein